MATVAASLERDDNFLAPLDHSVWLMDNHKWALYVWESFRTATGIPKFSLVHADFHWDGGYDFFHAPEMQNVLLNANLRQLRALIEEEKWIRYDSFIAPAVARGMFDCMHFFCTQGEEFGVDIGVAPEVRDPVGTAQVVHESVASLVRLETATPLIFDLCLDLFNKSDQFQQGDLWTDEEILQFLNTIRPLMERAVLVTVSLSFDYSGSAEDTRHLAELVLPWILACRQLAEPFLQT